MAQFELVVKDGLTVLATIKGRELPDDSVRLSDKNKVIEVEQYLERMLGHRFHINQFSKKKG